MVRTTHASPLQRTSWATASDSTDASIAVPAGSQPAEVERRERILELDPRGVCQRGLHLVLVGERRLEEAAFGADDEPLGGERPRVDREHAVALVDPQLDRAPSRRQARSSGSPA